MSSAKKGQRSTHCPTPLFLGILTHVFIFWRPFLSVFSSFQFMKMGRTKGFKSTCPAPEGLDMCPTVCSVRGRVRYTKSPTLSSNIAISWGICGGWVNCGNWGGCGASMNHFHTRRASSYEVSEMDEGREWSKVGHATQRALAIYVFVVGCFELQCINYWTQFLKRTINSKLRAGCSSRLHGFQSNG